MYNNILSCMKIMNQFKKKNKNPPKEKYPEKLWNTHKLDQWSKSEDMHEGWRVNGVKHGRLHESNEVQNA